MHTLGNLSVSINILAYLKCWLEVIEVSEPPCEEASTIFLTSRWIHSVTIVRKSTRLFKIIIELAGMTINKIPAKLKSVPISKLVLKIMETITKCKCKENLFVLFMWIILFESKHLFTFNVHKVYWFLSNIKW